MKRYLHRVVFLLGCLVIPLLIFGKNLYIYDNDSNPVGEATVIMFDAQMDSIGVIHSDANGSVAVSNPSVKSLLVDHPSYSSILSTIETDTIRLSKLHSLNEVVIAKDLKTEYLTHESYQITLEQMKSYNNFYQALNEIPNLVVLSNGALFFEGNSNVKLLLNGVSTGMVELSSLAKDDVSKINVYKDPPARYATQGYASVIDILTKDRLYGGNMGVNIDQAFHPLKGDNSLAMFYNYRRSRFSMIYSNSNSHFKKFILDEELDYTHDDIHYNKKKEGVDSKSHSDENTLSLSFQNNLANSYLYNLNVGGTLNRDNQSLWQNVTSNISASPSMLLTN